MSCKVKGLWCFDTDESFSERIYSTCVNPMLTLKLQLALRLVKQHRLLNLPSLAMKIVN